MSDALRFLYRLTSLQRGVGQTHRKFRFARAPIVLLVSTIASSCGGDHGPTDTPGLRIASIIIDGGNRALERGTKVTLTATATDTGGKAVTIPLAWRSSADSIVTMGPDGQLTAKDTGVAAVIASALGVVSAPIGIHVVWQGPAKVAVFQFNPPAAVSPDGQVGDSIRVVVTNLDGNPVQANLRFTVTSGGGTISPAAPALVKVGQGGWAAAQWRFGITPGQNVVTATVVGADSLPIPWVTGNPATFSVTTYDALSILSGDHQTGSILATLPTAPAVRLVDSAGHPRAAVPVAFSATGNGRVVNAVASTAADGTVSSGAWTLGDATGDQQLIVTVEGARVILHATATGTPVQYHAAQVATTFGASCAVGVDSSVSCLGQSPQNGTGDTASRSMPTPTSGSTRVASLVGGSTHLCGITTDSAITCWGLNAYVDTTGATISSAVPRRLPSNTTWLQVSPGERHNCALASDHSAYCWGENNSGQLGDNTTGLRLAPQPVFGGFKFDAIAVGGSHSCGILSADSTALCWGLNGSGQIGDASTTTRPSPTAISGGIRWKSIGAGGTWTCGLATDGEAYCWGSLAGRNTPTAYAGLPTFSSLSVGTGHACALTSDGRAYCWGDNTGGQLGDSTTTPRFSPTEVVTSFRFASISAGFLQTCGITTEGLLACWGRNTVGEIGISVPVLQLTPRYIVVGVNP